MKRRAAKRLLFLLLGAIVNVAVAWALAILTPSSNNETWTFAESPDAMALWGEAPFAARYVNSPLKSQRIACRERLGKQITFGSLATDYEPSIWYEGTKRWMALNVDRGYIFRVAAGWPTLAMSGDKWTFRACWHCELSAARRQALYVWSAELNPVGSQPVAPNQLKNRFSDDLLPLKPLWPGFLINTLFYAAILWMLFAFPFTLRRWRCVRKGLCPACAYPVGESNVCTECGKLLIHARP